jgi:hypothetical protein
MSSFTYIIRSNDREILSETPSSCHIRLEGLPQQFKYFECEVVQFNVGRDRNFATETIELRAESLGFQNGVDTNSTFKTCAVLNFVNAFHQGPFRFTTDNFNSRYVKFELYNSSNNILKKDDGSAWNFPWVLILNMKGIEN